MKNEDGVYALTYTRQPKGSAFDTMEKRRLTKILMLTRTEETIKCLKNEKEKKRQNYYEWLNFEYLYL